MVGHPTAICLTRLVTSVVLLTAAPGYSRTPGHRALIVGFSPFGQTVVRRAIDLAIQKVALPECAAVYADFELAKGGTPRDALNRTGMAPEELFESLVFVEGSRDPSCRRTPAVLKATPGRYVIAVCPEFAQVAMRDPGLSASLIIHESLHALGLGEDPPSSKAITRQVERRCWKAAATGGPVSQALPVSPVCTSCDEVVSRVIPLLPARPPRIVVLDIERAPGVLRQRLEHVEAFVIAGESTVYIKRQGLIFSHALRGPGVWDYVLAITIWHEMAHLAGADEKEAQQREEALWMQFITARRIDYGRGLVYLQQLKKRRS